MLSYANQAGGITRCKVVFGAQIVQFGTVRLFITSKASGVVLSCRFVDVKEETQFTVNLLKQTQLKFE
jgi:hypothetical protein